MGKIDKIRLKDFKSFRNAVIPFVDGFTTVVGPNGSGKCVIGSTEVILASGRKTTVGELVEDAISSSSQTIRLDDGEYTTNNPQNASVISLNPQTLKIEAKPIRAFIRRTAPGTLIRLKTKSGREITTTAYHPVFTVKEGRVAGEKAENIGAGTRIAVPRILPQPSDENSPIALTGAFVPADRVYAPHTPRLASRLRGLCTEAGSQRALIRAAQIPPDAIRSVFSGQPMNLCTLQQLDDEYEVSEIKCRGSIHVPREMDNRLARFLGYMISEGVNRSTGQVRFVNDDDAMIRDFCGAAERCFGKAPAVFDYKGGTKDVIIFSSALGRLLDRVFGFRIDGRSADKMAPPQLFSSPNPVVSAFLSSLFEGDGYVNPGYIEYATASQRLAKDVQTLLLRLGITSSIKEKWKLATNSAKAVKRPYYSVMIYGTENLGRFKGSIRFVGRKQEQLAAVAARRPNPNHDLIDGLHRVLKRYVRAAGVSIKKARAAHPRLAAYYENRCSFSRQGLGEVLEFIGRDDEDARLLRRFAESDVLWDEVVGIERLQASEGYVYDLTVEGNHNFVAENIFVHNSNLNDAILFVLGEGSMKSLRAGRLTDLVHHSSKTGEAEVTIEFKDNADRYTISRSIDKSGSSVYRLNGKRTTRAGLVELLSTMHVPPEGHNIIMQGDVMSIINMTPKQRREVIDDISGIAEYNQKKDKAMNELEQVEGKVKEANIILYERGGYLKEIKKERDEALRYRRFEEERKDLKHAIIATELKEVEANYTQARDKVAALEKDLDGLRAEMKNASARISNWEQQLGALQKEIMAKGEKEQIAISREIEQLKSKLSLTQEKVRNRHEDIRDAEAEIQRARHAIETSKGESAEKRKQLALLRQEDASYEARVKEKEAGLAAYMAGLREKNLLVGDSMQRLEEMNAAIAKRKEAFYELKGKLDQLREKISVRKLSVSDRGAEREESDKRTDDLREAFDGANKQFAEHKRSLKGFEQELEGLFGQEKALNKELADADSQLDTTREGYHSLQSKVATIRSMTGNTASDSVMKAKAELPGIIGRVEDLCTFDVKHATALQAAAGARMHFIVTKDVAAAANAIKWLKARKLGRTTFIPLDRIRPTEIGQEAQDAMRHPKAVDFAIKLVEFRKEHHEVFSFVFGDTVVVQDIDAVKEIDDAAKKRGAGGCRMATLDGDLAEASGTLTGGFQQGVLTLQEVKKLDELKNGLESLQKRHDKTVRQLEELREKMNYTRGQKAEVELKVKEFDVRVGELQHRIDEHLAMAKKYTLSADDIKKEIDGLKAELGEGDGALKRMQEGIAEAERRKDEAREKADSPEAKVVSERLEDMQKRVQALRDQRAEVIIQINSITAELERFIGEREKAHGDTIAENERLAKKWREEIAGLEADDKAVQATLREKMAAEKEITSSVHGLIGQRDGIEAEMRKLAEQRGQLQRQTESKQSQFNDENFSKAKWQTRFADLRAEFDENAPVKEFKLTVEEMKAEAEELAHKMKNLEPINLAAIEKYDKYLSELDGMKEKAKKLEEEKLAVFSLMQEIEARRKGAFIETFNEIRRHFDVIYKQFYPGTDAFADIKLQNEEDPFEAGLLIEARPAGKPMKIIDAMSGGEKTLAALAFLFGVQAYKPSPFYILDEADAALDKPNSERLAQMIKTRSSDCQFIVITHNNPMIHQSDQIVGVSMDKKAGSSIVEVDLKRLPAAQGGEAALKV